MITKKTHLVITLLCLIVNYGCFTLSDSNDRVRFTSFGEIKTYLLKKTPLVTKFKSSGPYFYEITHDFLIRIGKNEIINSDLYMAKITDKAPLIIIQHGNHANKDVHRKQALRLASWGMHVLVLQQPNEHQWIKNGERLGKLIKLLYKWPYMLNKKFDPNNIIAIGHSFGSSAVAIAAGSNAPLKGIIFLDPALFHKTVKGYINKISVPSILLGADKRVFRSKKRRLFYRLIPKNIVEVSVHGATHNDAQYPNLFSWSQFFGIERSTSQRRQELFVAAITTGVFSFVLKGDSNYAWYAYKAKIKEGKFINIKRK